MLLSVQPVTTSNNYNFKAKSIKPKAIMPKDNKLPEPDSESGAKIIISAITWLALGGALLVSAIMGLSQAAKNHNTQTKEHIETIGANVEPEITQA